MCSARLRDQGHKLQYREFQLNTRKKIPLQCCSNTGTGSKLTWKRPSELSIWYSGPCLNYMTFPGTLQSEFYNSMNSKSHFHSKDSQSVVCLYAALGSGILHRQWLIFRIQNTFLLGCWTLPFYPRPPIQMYQFTLL